jgi:hypothetical protein
MYFKKQANKDFWDEQKIILFFKPNFISVERLTSRTYDHPDNPSQSINAPAGLKLWGCPSSRRRRK